MALVAENVLILINVQLLLV